MGLLALFCWIMARPRFLLGPFRHQIKFSFQADKVKEGSKEGERNSFPCVCDGVCVCVCVRERDLASG